MGAIDRDPCEIDEAARNEPGDSSRCKAPRSSPPTFSRSFPPVSQIRGGLSGATGDERQGIRRLSAFADEFGFLFLSPASEEGTRDAIRSGYGPDVRFVDQALTRVFTQRRVDLAGSLSPVFPTERLMRWALYRMGTCSGA
jgi:hypothetical protein